MKSVSLALQSHLQQELTTLTTCWEIKRRDGRFFRFTDHTSDLVVGGNSFRSDIGYSRSAIQSTSGLSVDNLQVQGIFDDEAITEKDLRDGLFDFAEVKVFLVNYEDLSQGILRLKRGTLGEVQSVSYGQFAAELRGLAQKLQQVIGNLYQTTCRAQLGGLKRCKFPIDPAVVQRLAAYKRGDFVKVYTGNATSVTLPVPFDDADFEDLSAWTVLSGSPAAKMIQDDLTPVSGSFFLGSNSSSFEISQEVDLTTVAGFSGVDLDSGFYFLNASIRRASSAFTRSSGRVRLEALALNGEVLGELWNTGYENISPPEQWVLRSADSVLLPIGTRRLRIFLDAASQGVSNSRAAFDDLGVEIIDNNGTTGVYAGFENRIYECVTAGETDAVAPTYDQAIDALTVDGTAEFEARDAFTRNASVVSVTTSSQFLASITPSSAGSVNDWFNGGQVIWETGQNAGLSMEVRDYVHSAGDKTVVLFLPMPNTINSGDKFRMVPGCNRTREDCRDKFRIANSVNLSLGNMKEYDGEPDVPGPDAVLTYPDAT